MVYCVRNRAQVAGRGYAWHLSSPVDMDVQLKPLSPKPNLPPFSSVRALTCMHLQHDKGTLHAVSHRYLCPPLSDHRPRLR